MPYRLIVAASLIACTQATAQSVVPTEPTAPTAVTASADRVWSAALEFLALTRMPLRIVDGVSRFAVTELHHVSRPESEPGAECGRDAVQKVGSLAPSWGAHVTISLLVAPNGEASTVRAVARFQQSDRMPCGPSNGSYERAIQEWIRDRATKR